MARLWVVGMAVSCLVLPLLWAGPAPFGRVLMGLGLPGLAAELFREPDWRGAAHYREGEYGAAAEAFREAGAHLNLGNAEAMAGRYAEALEAYDIARLGGDAGASANFDLVAAYYAGLALDPDAPVAWFTEKDGNGAAVKSSVAQGNARAAGAGDGSTNSGTLLGLPELQSHGTSAVRKVFDDKFIVANRRWLQTLPDVPGAYLAARIRHESKRRQKLGLAQPQPEDPR